jgi:hypothetical protein
LDEEIADIFEMTGTSSVTKKGKKKKKKKV